MPPFKRLAPAKLAPVFKVPLGDLGVFEEKDNTVQPSSIIFGHTNPIFNFSYEQKNFD